MALPSRNSISDGVYNCQPIIRHPPKEAVIQLRNVALILVSVVPAKAGTQGFRLRLLGPRFRGDDELTCPGDFLTASKAGVQGLPCGMTSGRSPRPRVPGFPHSRE